MNEQLAVLPRAAVHTRHYLRVPVHTAQQMESRECMAGSAAGAGAARGTGA